MDVPLPHPSVSRHHATMTFATVQEGLGGKKEVRCGCGTMLVLPLLLSASASGLLSPRRLSRSPLPWAEGRGPKTTLFGEVDENVVGEGDECNGSLPPEFATICAEGLTCVTSGVPGASGTCQAEASFGIPFDCRVDFFAASRPELSILNALFVFDSNNFIDLYDPPSDPEGLVYTAFLPNNDAFEALFATANITLDELLAGEVTINENVNNLLFYHGAFHRKEIGRSCRFVRPCECPRRCHDGPGPAFVRIRVPSFS